MPPTSHPVKHTEVDRTSLIRSHREFDVVVGSEGVSEKSGGGGVIVTEHCWSPTQGVLIGDATVVVGEGAVVSGEIQT